MMRLFVAAVAASMAALCANPGPVQGQVIPGPKVAVHLDEHEVGVDACPDAPELNEIACPSFITRGDLLVSYDLYIVIAQGDTTDGVSGITFGIDYNGIDDEGIDLFGNPLFTKCADGNAYPSTGWPAPGTGNTVTWNPQTTCQKTKFPPYGVHATVGSFYVYAYTEDTFAITEHTKLQFPTLSVADCSSAETELTVCEAGIASFGTEDGKNPCLQGCVPVEPTTWGRIKAMFPRPDE